MALVVVAESGIVVEALGKEPNKERREIEMEKRMDIGEIVAVAFVGLLLLLGIYEWVSRPPSNHCDQFSAIYLRTKDGELLRTDDGRLIDVRPVICSTPPLEGAEEITLPVSDRDAKIWRDQFNRR